MGSHPINLGIRFLLELTVLFAVGYWAWKSQTGFAKYFLAFGLPIVLATIWGVFAVPNDPSRSGETVIAVSGWLRLLIELAIFAVGIFALYKGGYNKLSLIFAIIVVVHYLASYDRINWLLKQ